MTQDSSQENSINLITQSDQELNSADILSDIAKCKRLIRRSEFKIKIYNRKLNLARYFGTEKKTLIDKGLELFNLKKKFQSRV